MIKREWGRVISLLLIICMVISIAIPYKVNANIIDDSTSFFEIENDGETVLKVIMKKGVITIIAISHAATTDIRYETIGLSFTRSIVPESATAKGYTGPTSINSENTLTFSNGEIAVGDPANGVVPTTFTFSSRQVSTALDGETFEDITQGTPIYMHAIFRTYDNGSNATRRPYISNWKDIMNAEQWGSDTLKGFKKYYNMKIEFMPEDNINTLYYETESGSTIKDAKPLATAKIGDPVNWDEDPTITYENKEYEVIGFFATRKINQQIIENSETYKADGWTVEEICSNSINVVLGGVDVHLVYQLRTTPPPTPTPRPGDPTPIPIPTATPRPSATPMPTPTPIVVPQAETVSAIMNPIEAEGRIRADDRGSEKFVATLGVPTTESLFTEVKATNWLMGYILTKKVGVETYAVTVSKSYNLTWTGQDALGDIPLSETVTVRKVVTIQRAYGYWEIINFDLYKIDNANITNYALPNGFTTMTPDYSAGYSPPSITTNHTAVKASHIVIPSEISNGLSLSSETISGGTSKPSVPHEDFTRQADQRIPELKVKNDTLILNGTTVMNPSPTTKEGPRVNSSFLTGLRTTGIAKCNDNILYKPVQIIEATKKNGTYNSAGVITYNRVNSINSGYTNTMQNSILNLNTVVIHTPVLCDPIVTADNDKYVQLLNPTAAVQLVLDPDSSLNDFNVFISNYGPHSNKQGYYTRDFSRSLIDPVIVSYIASSNGMLRNEVKFPFDVNMKQASGDTFIKKNTWIVLGRNTVTFSIPMWIVEGTYTVDCRTIAVNADMNKLEEISELYANTELFNYVATNTFQMEVSGRIYGLSIYDLTDYPMWKEAFRIKNSSELKINDQDKYPDGTNKTTYSKGYSYNYTVGTNDQYGKDTTRNVKYTFPLVNGSHPFYKNIGVLKTGYVVRFKLNTIGTMYGGGCSIKIKPTFYHVDADGKNRTAVDLYYEEEIDGKNRSMVKVGSDLDMMNVKTMEAGSPYAGIPTTEMKDTASILKMKYTKFIYNRDTIFTFKGINMLSTFRTFINKNYTKAVVNSDQYPKIQETGVTQDMMMKQMQSWYGCYYLPGILHAVDPKDVPDGLSVYDYAHQVGVTYHEDFWKKDGYIIVNFDLVTIDSNGEEHLSYINASNYLNKGNNSMWVMEGAPLSKVDNKDVTFNFKVGDFIIYYMDKSVHEDYSSGGIY